MSFSERESLILEVLREAGRPIVGADLADLLGVSPRTLRYDIGRINRGLPLVVSDSAGYTLNLPAYRGVLSDAPWVASVLDDDERLLVYLLDHNRCSLYDAATDCYLGESAVRSAVARLAPRLEGKGLKLSMSASTINLEGSELDRRRVLGGLVREAANAPLGGQQRLRRLLPEVDLEKVEFALERALADTSEPVDDISRQNLVVNLAICLQRSANPIGQLPAEPEAAAFDRLSDRVVQELLRAFPSRVIGADNQAHLRRLVTVALDNAMSEYPPVQARDDHAAIRDVVTRAVDDCITHFDLRVHHDKLVDSITQHTRRLIARSATLVYFRNSLRESLRTRSPYLYDVAVYLAHQISSSLEVQVSDDEISLFAIYLGLYADHHDASVDAVSVTIVCPRYQTLREWLLARFVEQFGGRVTIVDVVTAVREAEVSDSELIVTTMGGTSPSRPVIEISALCSEMDIEAVRAEIVRIRDERERSRTASELARFLDSRLFFVDAQFRDAASTIDFLCQKLVEVEKVPVSYVDSVRIRESYSSTAFAYRFAVPHSMDFIAHQTTIAVLVPKTPIKWGESDVVMVLMLAVNQDDYADFSRFYQRLIQLLCDPELFSELRRKRDFPAFRDYLAERLWQAR